MSVVAAIYAQGLEVSQLKSISLKVVSDSVGVQALISRRYFTRY